MSEPKVLSNPIVLIGGVALTGWCHEARVTRGYATKPDNAFGDVAEEFRAGVEKNSASLSIYMSYAAAATYSILKSLVGTKVILKVNPAPGADSATNPGWVLTNTFLGDLPLMDAKFNELVSVQIDLQGGSYTEDVTP